MKITTITIVNFRNIEYQELTLADANFLIGMNGAGKSSIINAIQMAVYGWCQHTDRSGKGFKDLIGPWGDKARIVVTLTDHVITLDLGSKREYSAVNTETGELYDTPHDLMRALNINPLEALVTMYPRDIVCSREFSTLLMDYMEGAVNATDIEIAIPADKRGMVRDYARAWNIPLAFAVDYSDLGARAYERRRDVGGDLKHAKKSLESMGFVKPAHGDLAELSRSLDELLMQRGAAMAASTDDPEPLRAERSQLMEKLQHAESYEQARRAFNDANTAHLDAIHKMNSVVPVEKVCPTCARKLPAEMLKKLQEQYETDFAALRASVDRAAALRDETQQAMWAAEVGGGSLMDSNALRNRLAELRILIDRAETAYTGPSLHELDIAIESTQASALAVKAYQEHKTLTAEVAGLQEEYDRLDWLVKQFHDGALINALIVDITQSIIDRTGEPLQVRADDKWLALYYDGRPLAQASEGQKAMVAAALALAFADCGAPILLDDINDLDPVRRGRLLAYLADVSAGTIVVAGTPLVGQLAPLATEIAPMHLIRVADGSAATVAT